LLVFSRKICISSSEITPEDLARSFDSNVDRILTGEEDLSPLDQEVLVDFNGNVLTKNFD